MSIQNNNSRKRRRNLRKQQTSAEKKLWSALRDRKLAGRKFRRQHPVGPFIVDFYCHQERLIIEVDGSIHEDPLRASYDRERHLALEAGGYRILRFTNQMVHDHIEEVTALIIDTFVG